MDASVAFYSSILGEPVERSPGFALYVFDTSGRLGLWKRDAVAPSAEGAPGASESATAPSRAEIDRLRDEWAGRGVAIARPPTRMEFGYTFVARDPDGHRPRVFAPGD